VIWPHELLQLEMRGFRRWIPLLVFLLFRVSLGNFFFGNFRYIFVENYLTLFLQRGENLLQNGYTTLCI